MSFYGIDINLHSGPMPLWAYNWSKYWIESRTVKPVDPSIGAAHGRWTSRRPSYAPGGTVNHVCEAD